MVDISPTLFRKDDVYFEENNISNFGQNLEKKDLENNNKIKEDPNESSKNIDDDQFIENLSNILKKILDRFKEVDLLLPESNKKIIEIINKLEPNSVISQINNISNIILEELKKIEDYIKSKVPKKGLKKGQSNLVLPIIVNKKIIIEQNLAKNSLFLHSKNSR